MDMVVASLFKHKVRFELSGHDLRLLRSFKENRSKKLRRVSSRDFR